MVRLRPRLRLLACSLGIAALSTACGSTSGSSSPAVASSASAIASGAAPAAALARVHATCQQTTWKANLRLTVDDAGQNAMLSADVLADPRPDHLAAHLTTTTGLEEEAVDGFTYVRQGASKWGKVASGSLPASETRPPCSEFTVFSGPGITGVQELSDQSGGSAHHYRFQADAYTLLSASALFSPAALAPFQKTRVQISADLYTDAQGRPLSYQTDTADVADSDGGMVQMTLIETYSDYGTAVTVAAPDPSQVTDGLPPGLLVESPPNPAA